MDKTWIDEVKNLEIWLEADDTIQKTTIFQSIATTPKKNHDKRP